ncbi:MAG: PVC-type heme-binding CxxCH protein [Gemmataceae bacterium]
MRFALSAICAFAVAHGTSAQQPSLVAPTNALSPEDEQKALIVPDGFEVQLVASEPQIQKPMQMAFDAKGRIWVTTSYHYPFAAPAGKATDKLFILSDFDAKGKARKVQTFAADLNIPIGILPLPDCKSCIVSSVGEILKLTDEDGDGKYDKKEVLFAGFGSRDTHGMYNSYTLMPDGWVYACHGFNNDSKTKGKDGRELAMQSGNTFRFKPDGSKIEAFTRGQVNPFGMCVDPWFNFYTADCHSKPITNLIPGAVYESFGKPHDGLGFGPVMFGYDPGGTGLCGVAWYDADHFPASYKGNLFLGNVVTSRVNMCKVEWTGATPKAVQQPDLIVSKDPWFRPVDIKLGPDGAVYVNDFYNKIIGHYEVDLKHPGRDKDRGRIWRVVSTKSTASPKAPRSDWTTATDTELVSDLTHPNLTVRFLAGNQFLARARAGKKPKAEDAIVGPLLQNPKSASNVAGWLSFAGEADNAPPNYADLLKAARELEWTPDQCTSLTLRALASHEKWTDDDRKVVLGWMAAFDAPRLKRAGVEAIASHPHADFVKPLVELLGKVLPGDDHMRHAVRIALRNCLRGLDDQTLEALVKDKSVDGTLADIMLGIPTSSTAKFLSGFIATRDATGAFPAYAEHIGRYGNREARRSVQQTFWSLTRVNANESNFRVGVQVIRQLARGMQAGGAKFDGDELPELRFVGDQTVSYFKADPASARLAIETLALLPALGDSAGFSSNELDRFAKQEQFDADVRGAAFDALSRVDYKRAYPLLKELVQSSSEAVALREKALVALANVPMREARGEVNVALKGVPYRVAVAVALNMVATKIGGEELLASVKAGFMPARVLQEKLVLERLRAANIPGFDKQLADLTKGLPPADQRLAELIKQRTVKFTGTKLDKEAGAKLFTKHCGACHRIGNDGGKVGPNLDGVGLRGLERLLEDTLDPNRNVDAAFRARVLNLVDGTTKTGLMLRVEGEVLVMADDQGKEFRVPTKDIEKNRETALSPMPANFGEAIPEADFYQLIGWLLDQKTKETPKKE